MYKMDIQVRYSEVDGAGAVRLHQIVDYFQDCGTFHSISLGLGMRGVPEEYGAWYLLAWDIRIKRYPKLCERLTVTTEPYEMKGFYGYRRYSLIDEGGAVIADADSIWILMNTEKMCPMRVSAELTNTYIPVVPDQTRRVKRKLSAEGEWKKAEHILISKIYLDSNHHVNNANYITWAEELLPDGYRVNGVKVDYRQSAFYGDELDVYVEENEKKWRVSYKNQEDTLIALVELTTEKI